MNKLLLIVSLLIPLKCFANDRNCKAFMIYKEARGEPEIVQKAVLDVMENRMKLYKKSACEVLEMKGQYPYARKGIKNMSNEWLTLVDKLGKLPHILNSDFLYFNSTRHRFKKKHKKIGNLYFC